LNGDGKPDLVLRNQVSGIAIVIYLDGVNATGAGLLPTVSDLSWVLVGPH